MTGLVQELVRRGVVVVSPDQTYVASEVQPDRIAPGVVLHPGARLSGPFLSIGPGSVIGEEGPVTIENAVLGSRVHVRAGYLAGSVCHDDVRLGGASHVRPGCLLEEWVSTGHAVGLKQTVLFPFVTLGSLINFCDLLMAGGQSAAHHSEVGSSYVHFNYTPQHDKATASLIGNVPDGVLLDQSPVFLGGQGGLVGPRSVAFGAVVPAGVIVRADIPGAGLYRAPEVSRRVDRPYDERICTRVSARWNACLHYIAQIRALHAWYRHARPALSPDSVWIRAGIERSLRVLDSILAERVARLEEWLGKVFISRETLRAQEPQDTVALGEHDAVLRSGKAWCAALASVESPDCATLREAALSGLMSHPRGYVAAVQSLSPATADAVRLWLRDVVSTAMQKPASVP